MDVDAYASEEPSLDLLLESAGITEARR